MKFRNLLLLAIAIYFGNLYGMQTSCSRNSQDSDHHGAATFYVCKALASIQNRPCFTVHQDSNALRKHLKDNHRHGLKAQQVERVSYLIVADNLEAAISQVKPVTKTIKKQSPPRAKL